MTKYNIITMVKQRKKVKKVSEKKSEENSLA